ncbi:hypothetical protein F5148DRAFT_1148691 [Russula earlei]|uniref:Uncharacterized protein n=1 Tax=Russula earlei TaxID=71964 RepID=A0ACC0UB65_9AGAM|nr:hypothetical protein F5148DRAFT_1148691 [Russula earlei]
MDQDWDQDWDQDQDMEIGHNAAAPKSQFKMEWDAFEHDAMAPMGAATTTADPQEMYARMTITMEPKLVPRFIGLPEGVVQGQPLEDGVDHGVGGEGHRRKTGS